MASLYGIFITLHLLSAIIFIGAVFFEVLVIEPLERTLPDGLGARLADAVPERVRQFMPFVVLTLFLSGLGMFWTQFTSRPDFFQSRFGILLSLKLVLVFAVLGIFVASVRAMKRGQADLCRLRHTHRIVAALMLGIVLLAKGMYYL